MGDGHSENGPHAITQYLVHRLCKAVDSLHHDVNRGVKEFLRLLRVQVPNELGGIFDDGKQDGDDLAFTCKTGLAGQDFFAR